MDGDTLKINLKSVDNIMDLANFIKRVFGAEIHFFDENNENGLAFSARFNADKLIKKSQKAFICIYVYLSGKSDLYEKDFMEHLFVENEKLPRRNFSDLSGLLHYLILEVSQISFPDPSLLNKVGLVDLDVRNERIEKWKELLMDLVPYGAVVEDCRDDTSTDKIFDIALPYTQVPKEEAEKNEYQDEYHSDDSNWYSLYPNENWVDYYKEFINKLEKIYNVPILPNSK